MTQEQQMTFIDEEGVERLANILFTVDSPDGEHHYTVFTDATDPDQGAFVYEYNDFGEMNIVTDEEALQFVQEVYDALMDEEGLINDDEAEEA